MNGNEKISKYFTYGEVTKANPDLLKRLGVSNKPGHFELQRIKDLCTSVLDPLREALGYPIGLTSVYREKAYNTLIGGANGSQHTRGEAADIDNEVCGKGKNSEIFNYIKENLEFDQLIWEFGNDKEPDWVHVSYVKGKNRKQITKAIRQNGKTKYLLFV